MLMTLKGLVALEILGIGGATVYSCDTFDVFMAAHLSPIVLFTFVVWGGLWALYTPIPIPQDQYKDYCIFKRYQTLCEESGKMPIDFTLDIYKNK